MGKRPFNGRVEVRREVLSGGVRWIARRVSLPNDSDIFPHAQRMPSIDKPFATLPRFCVHDIDRNFVDDVEPTRVSNATI